MSDKSSKESIRFSEICSAEAMIKYLESTKRRSNISFLHHYTTIDVAVKIIRDKQWHLCAAEHMNDMLEFKSGAPEKWKNILFSSLMGEDKESIAMWSMYGQPWERGVKISIPKEKLHPWLAQVTKLNEISTENYNPTGRFIKISNGTIKAIAVAYSNYHDIEDEGKPLLRWSTATNDTYPIPTPNLGVMTGYIKNKAWAYEKEHRIMFNQNQEYKRGSIDITEDIINSLILTPSPLFEGDFLDELSKTVEREVKIQQSLFFQKLKINTNCSKCKHRQKAESAS